MKPTLVTGASGFLGWHIARLLLDRGHQVRALCRENSVIRELEVERVTGDLRDRASLDRAVAGCGLVFHAAAEYRLWTKHPETLYQTNVEGTRHLLAAAGAAGVERVVYTSTVGCIGIPRNGVGDETTPVSFSDMQGNYKRSKWLAEQVALKTASEGLPVVIVNPTAPVGDHDWRPTPTGKTIVDFLRGRIPAYIDTGLNLVDARDIALGHLFAAEHGRCGDRYILGCENLTLEQILERLGAISGRKPPTTRLPYAIAYLSGLVSTGWAGVTGIEPLAPLEGVRMARKKMWVRQDKSFRELGFEPGPVNEALKRAVHWFQSNGYC